MKYLFLILASWLITTQVSSQTSDTLHLRNQDIPISKTATIVLDTIKSKKVITSGENINTTWLMAQKRMDSLSLEIQKLNKRIDLQKVQSQATGIYLKRSGYYFAGMLVTSFVSSACAVLSAYYANASTPKRMDLAYAFDVIGVVGSAISISCYVAISINLVNAGKAMQKNKLYK